MNIMFLHCPWVSDLFDVLDKIGTANLYFYEPKVRPDKHHLLPYRDSWSNENGQQNLADKLMNFTSFQLLYTSLQ